MSPPNVELLAQGFTSWGKDNPAHMRDVLHPDCELVVGRTARERSAGWAFVGLRHSRRCPVVGLGLRSDL
jgi:hypothetical protein